MSNISCTDNFTVKLQNYDNSDNDEDEKDITDGTENVDSRYQLYLNDKKESGDGFTFVSAEGYLCSLQRNLILGIWCGYVTLSKDFKIDENQICINRSVNKYKKEDNVRIYFDCGSSMIDFIPVDYTLMGNTIPIPHLKLYRDFNYTLELLKLLSKEIKRVTYS